MPRLASGPAPAAPGLGPGRELCALLAPGHRRVCAARRLTESPAESASTPPTDPIGKEVSPRAASPAPPPPPTGALTAPQTNHRVTKSLSDANTSPVIQRRGGTWGGLS